MALGRADVVGMGQLGDGQISLATDPCTHLVPTVLRADADALDRTMAGT